MDGRFTIDLDDFSPGFHTLNVVATSDDGEVDSADTIVFFVPEDLGEAVWWIFFTFISIV